MGEYNSSCIIIVSPSCILYNTKHYLKPVHVVGVVLTCAW